jgi:two-component system NtrC family response regulator
MKPPLLIVEDDRELQLQLRRALAPNYEVATAADRASALQSFRALKPLVVVLSLGLPPTRGASSEGFATLADLLTADPQVKVIVVGGPGEREAARYAISSGAYDHLSRPLDPEELKLVLRRSFHLAWLEHDFRHMRAQIPHDTFEGLLGTCPAMQNVFEVIRKVAATDAPVLILGESGTGKAAVARAIHQRSLRNGGPFVAVHCSALPANLIECELFGHEQAAPTGTRALSKGRIELAQGGTLYIGEVGDVPQSAQGKLLSFLQDQAIERVGGWQPIPVDSRVIAATRATLDHALAAGKFRKDLFYRVAVVQVVLPPLRERGEDVILLANFFLSCLAADNGKSGLGFGRDGLQAIRRHSWPGNVRELQSRIRHAVIMCSGREISAADLELEAPESAIAMETGLLRSARERVEREMVSQALRRNAGNISVAAGELGISRPTFYELLKKLGVERKPSDSNPPMP